jgi:signal transduction histidine kinase/DNA-binding NarL/FixJ family response regulator
MKTAASCAALVFLLLLRAGSASAALPVDDLSKPFSISGQWRIQLGDDPAWAAVDLDDSSWSLTTVPAAYPEGHAGYTGMLWYRLTLDLDPSQPSVLDNLGALAVTLGDVMSAYEVFAGGQRIGSVGRLPPEPQAVYDHHQTFSIPTSAIDSDGRLVLAMRVWRDPGAPDSWETGPHGGEYLLGNVGDLREGMLQKALLLAGYTFETSQSRFFVDVPYLWHKKIEFLLLYISPFLLGRTLLAVTRTPENLLTRGFHLVFLVYFLAVLLVPGAGIMQRTLASFQYLGPLWALSMALIMGWRAFHGSRAARGVVALMVLLAAATINDVILETPLIGSGNSLYIVFAFMLLFIALMMAERYTEILKQLEISVEQRTAELVETNRELETAVETKGNFLANMSHEMRTPMNAILGLTHLGLKTDLDDQQRDYLSKVERSAEDLQDIIDSILDFSKLEEGQLSCSSEPFSLAAMVEGIERTWKETAEEAGLAFATSVDPGIPGALIGDGKRIKQVLGNLISNGVKYTDQGQVTLSISRVSQSEQAVRLGFAVADTGIGIAPEQRDKLFEAFSQADNTMTRQHGGTGLGLSIAQRLVELMGGHIELESTLGEGSTFHFELELLAGSDDLVVEEAPGEIDLLPIRGARILLVDDSELNLQVAGELLRQAKLYVDLAEDGAQAVEKALAGQYDCVLMDVQMPVMDGYTATERIRAEPGLGDLPILAMTANAMPQDRARGAEAGMNDYVPKPIEPDELYRALLKWIAPGERQFDEGEFIPAGSDEGTSDDLPNEMPGIKVSEGLARVGGNAALFLDLLRGLCKDYADAPERLESMIASADQDGARQLAHKLRGIANNLGASELGACAESIELALKSGEPVADDALSRLRAALSLTGESQAVLSPAQESGQVGGGLSEVEQQQLLDELLDAVAASNPEALDVADKLLAGLSEDSGIREPLTAARDSLDIYDFAGAGTALQALENSGAAAS